jgi:CRISPR-associated protein Cas1
MAAAYILEQSASVGREGERLIVKKGGAVLHSLHIFKLDQLAVFGNVSLTPAAIAYLLQNGVDTVFMSSNGRYRGRLQAPHSKNITLRCEQFRKMSDERFCVGTTKAIVAGKLANMRTNLMRLNRSREDLQIEDHILALKQLQQKTSEAANVDSLRGYEGRGAAVYFEGYSRGFLAEGITFRKRVRRPPTDPVNALLSLGYTFLFNELLTAVNLVGFDPFLGCLHTVEYGRPSLALDLMEEWRPVLIDNLVLSVFNLKAITAEDFIRTGVESGGDGEEKDDPVDYEPVTGVERDAAVGREGRPPALPVKLTDAGFRKFIAQFERRMAEKVRFHLTGQQFSYRDCIREQVRHFARYVKGEDESYQPMNTR